MGEPLLVGSKRGLCANRYSWEAEHIAEELPFFLAPGNKYFTIVDRAAELVGYCCFGADAQVPGGNYHEPALDIGSGVRPDLTGQGHGRLFTSGVLAFARHTYEPLRFRVTVASFNHRARRVWERTVFQAQQTFQAQDQDRAYTILVRDA